MFSILHSKNSFHKHIDILPQILKNESPNIFLSPKFNKKPIYDLSTNKYQEFTNAYVYSVMVKTSNHTPDRAVVCREAINEWNNIKKKSVDDIDEVIWNYMATPLNLYDIQSIRYRLSIRNSS